MSVQAFLESEISTLVIKIESATNKQVLTIAECSEYSGHSYEVIRQAILGSKLKASGKRPYRITSIAFAKWLLGI